MTIQNNPGVPLGGLRTIGQIDATNPLCFEEVRNGMTIALDLLSTHTAGAPVVDEDGRYLGFINEMDVMREETFGPVLPIMTFKTDDEAIRLANDSDFGLTASVWTNNIGRGQQLARQIDAGTVTINEVLYTHAIAQTPWGGTKQSGLGRTHGQAGLMELVRPQHVHVNRLQMIPDLWWFNYDEGAGQLFRGFARRFASGSLFQASLLLPQMVRRWRTPRN